MKEKKQISLSGKSGEIRYDVRDYFNLSNNEYLLLDCVAKLQGSPKSKTPGYCNASPEYLTKVIGVAKRNYYAICLRLESLELIERHPESRKPRVTAKIYDLIVGQGDETSLPKIGDETSPEIPETVTKRHQNGDETSLHYNTVYNTDSFYNTNLSANAETPEKEKPNIPLKAKKEKTETPGPRRAAPKNDPPLSQWQETITCFEDVHRQNFTAAGVWIGFDWSGKELKGLKELRGKVQKDVQSKNGYEPGIDQILSALSRFFTEALKDDFTKNNWFTPSILNSRYQEIKQKIYAHANGTTAAKQRNKTIQEQHHDLLATVIANRRY